MFQVRNRMRKYASDKSFKEKLEISFVKDHRKGNLNKFKWRYLMNFLYISIFLYIAIKVRIFNTILRFITCVLYITQVILDTPPRNEYLKINK